jgi:hypothetical protein
MKTPEQWREYYMTHHDAAYSLERLVKDVQQETAQALSQSTQAKLATVAQDQNQLLKDNMLTKRQALIAQILCAEIAGARFMNSRLAREQNMVSAGQLADAILKQ